MSLYRFDKRYTVQSEIDANASQATTNDNAITALQIEKVDSAGGNFIPAEIDPQIAGQVWNDSGTLKVSTGA